MNAPTRGPRYSGHVAAPAPGSVILTAAAAKLLAEHLRARREPDDNRTMLVVRDLIRLSRDDATSRNHIGPWPRTLHTSEVDTTEAGRLLGLSPAGVRKRIRAGTLPARFDGRRWYIHRDTIKELE